MSIWISNRCRPANRTYGGGTKWANYLVLNKDITISRKYSYSMSRNL